jgi:hypothetical protein
MKGSAMSDDLVTRLRRGRIDKTGVRRAPEKVKREAAKYIEALEAALAQAEAERDAPYERAAVVLEAVAAGDLTPTEGAHLMGLVETYRRTLETSELEARVAALEC